MIAPTQPRALCAALLACALAAAPAGAQQTRTEAIVKAQAEKAAVLKPYVPNSAERILERIESRAWLDPTFKYGLYPTFASVYPGGGFTVGAGMRKYHGYYSHVDVRGSWSFSNYKLFEASAAAPRMANGTLDLTGRVGWRDATQIPFHGLGIDSTEDDRTNARINETYVEGAALYRPRRRVFLRGSGA